MGTRRSVRACFWAAVASGPLVLLAACGGGGGGTVSTPAPATTPTPTPTATATPTPTPTPTPTATSTPASVFTTSEFNRSDGPGFHNAITAWQRGANGTGVTIGIVDSGIDTSNPEFAGRINSASGDVVAGQSRGLLNAESDHGTRVAMVAAAARDNAGIMGIAWNAGILMARADDAGTCATKCEFDDVSIAAGVDRAVANGAKVINLSLGGDPASATMTSAIARAAAAGVVVVVSAGNDGTAEPDPFAVSLRTAGNGNVIIAGAVDDTGTIASFSDKAGAEKQWYLSALGVKICCTYQNGVIKTTTENGQSFVEVFSGTSFAAPQIAGAVALLRQAFPSLTAAQVVDLLLRTARDVGDGGTDAVYGRGILDIAAAFAPQGATSIAGTTTTVAVTGAGGTTTAAMGDAALGARVPVTVLDAYGRAYTINLAAGLRAAAPLPRLAGALAAAQAQGSVADERMTLAWSIDARARFAGQRWSGALRLSDDQAGGARALATRLTARLSAGTALGLAQGQGAADIVAGLQGRGRPAFLVAGEALGEGGFAQRPGMAVALRRQIGRWGLTLSAEDGEAIDPTWQRWRDPRESRALVRRFGLALDRRWGPLDAMLGAGWLDEERTLLGARLDPVFGARGADSLMLDAALGWDVARGWRLAGQWREMRTRPRAGGLLAPGSMIAASAWSADAVRTGVLGAHDSLALRIAQPLRIHGGGLALALPGAWDYDSQTASVGTGLLALAPRGRELDAELAYATPLLGGAARASLFWRQNPGNRADWPADAGFGLGWKTGF